MSTRSIKNVHEAQLVELAVHYTQDAIFIGTLDGELSFANAAASALFGYAREELTEGGLSLIWGHEALAGALSKAVNTSALPMHFNERMRCKDGGAITVDVDLVKLALGSGQQILIVMRDADKERNSLSGFPETAQGLDSAPVMVYITSQDWTILWANSDKVTGSGYSVNELIGRQSPLRRYLGEEDPEQLADIERNLERTGEWIGNLHSRRQNGEVYPAEASISIIDAFNSEQAHRLVMLTDLSAFREAERALNLTALYDPVTALPNRMQFEAEASRVFGAANPEIAQYDMLLIDVDKFGIINEARGYEVGDRILRELAERCRKVAGEDVIVSRHTSDTFAVLARRLNTVADVAALATRILDTFREPITFDEHTFRFSASIGISTYPDDGVSCGELLREANVALQRAKERGGNRFSYYQAGAEETSCRWLELSPLLHEAFKNGEFTAAFQPIIEPETRRIVSMEALARWKRKDGIEVGPGDFIPVAEQSGAIDQIFDTVLRLACRHLRALDSLGYPGLITSVNVSSRQCASSDFSERVMDIIDGEGVEHGRIILEITESTLMNQQESNADTLEVLRKKGIRIVIDDFGTGYSSFGYLKYLPVDGIKLDRVFVKDIPGDEISERLVSMILAMGRDLDIPVVAEGVETVEQARFLRERGCRRLQGFLFSRPLFSRPFCELLGKGPISEESLGF